MSTLHPPSHNAGLAHAADAGHAAHDHHEIGFIRKYVFSTDHKMIGIQFLFTTIVMLLVGGALALAVRWQLAFPWSSLPILGKLVFANEGGQISPEFYTMLFTMHASVMI
ncbi:MAG: cbb3-type cytochrome c oxidase subunit I, partial [Planctomycetaceae bacterium]|nr:cbb3-type cytochrome c oxidase subunit I [Planctomycetaceae bacterium]